jgi:hypothetical protein
MNVIPDSHHDHNGPAFDQQATRDVVPPIAGIPKGSMIIKGSRFSQLARTRREKERCAALCPAGTQISH